MTTSDRSVLVVVRHAPYAGGLASAGLDTCLASAAFDRPATLLFLGDGVFNLVPDQDAQAVGRRSIARQLASLPLYDIEFVYADAVAASRYQIDLEQAPLRCIALSEEAMRELMDSHAHLLGF